MMERRAASFCGSHTSAVEAVASARRATTHRQIQPPAIR
jgi:hypothetical protein